MGMHKRPSHDPTSDTCGHPQSCYSVRAAFICIIGRGGSVNETPLLRQWIVLRTLCARHYGVTLAELAAERGVSEKTIRRDLETFRQAGFPLLETTEGHGRKKWQIDTTKYQPGLTFAFDEAIALYLARHLVEPLAGTPFWEAIQRAFRKIRATFSDGALKHVDRFSGMFHQTRFGASDYAKKTDLLDQLMFGIENHRAVFITYRSLRATEPVSYPIRPYGLVYHHGSLYLVGWAEDHQQVRHWKVDRMEDAEATKVEFPPPEDFDLQDHLAQSFGVFQGDGKVHVKIHFSAEVARYVQESHWHASQNFTPQPDGSLIAEFDLDGTEEIKSWTLSFGRHAMVLEPEELREEVEREASEILRSYSVPSQQKPEGNTADDS